MAVNVRVTGPELLLEQNRRAFLRIEESIRQYSAHSRESIYLVRRPLDHSEDHVALLWAHGIALIEMVPFGGVIRGSKAGFWQAELLPVETVPPSFHTLARRGAVERERVSELFPNPYLKLDRMREELAEVLRGAAGNSSFEPGEQYRVAGVALFTAEVEAIEAEPYNALLSVLTLEDALARSIMHRPNLLRASEIPGATYSNEELDRMCGTLEDAAERWEQIRTTRISPKPEIPASSFTAPVHARRGHSPFWLVLILLALAVFTYIMIRVILIKSSTPSVSPPEVVSHTPSEIIIQTPVEAELFISPFQFQSREELDRALTYGHGIRFLPDRRQVVVMDSLALARGVYGYFKVEETWRKGMLLQTLQHSDTIQIVKFLDPLPFKS